MSRARERFKKAAAAIWEIGKEQPFRPFGGVLVNAGKAIEKAVKGRKDAGQDQEGGEGEVQSDNPKGDKG